MKLSDLLEQRAQAVQSLRTLSDSAEQAGRDLNEAEQRSFKETKDKITELDARIERQKQLDAMERAAPAVVPANSLGDNYDRRANEFSVRKALVASFPPSLREGPQEDFGLERELSVETERRAGRRFNGTPIPDAVFERRTTMLTSTTGAGLVGETHRADLAVDRLRSPLIVARLGATVIGDLSGTGAISIPRATASPTSEWVAEDAALTETSGEWDDIEMRPHSVGALTSFSRHLLLTSSPGIEQLIRNDISRVISESIDRAALFGTGAGAQPTGVRYAGASYYELEALSTGLPSWSDINAIIATAEGDNAEVENAGWAMSPWVKKVLRTTPKISGDGSAGYLMDGARTLADYPAYVSTIVPGAPTQEGTIIFGSRWADLLLAKWSGIDLLSNALGDQYFSRGRIGVRAFSEVDTAVRHPESFVYADNLLAS